MQKSLVIFFICFLLNGIQVNAQRYGTALGLRLGNSDINRTVGLRGCVKNRSFSLKPLQFGNFKG